MLRLEIINHALIKAGQSVVSAVTATKASRLLNAQYPYSLDAVLEAHPWDQFKKQTRLLPQEHTHIEFGYAYEFILPIDFVRLIEEEPKGFDYERAQGKLWANEDIFECSYVALPTNANWEEVPDWNTVPNWNDLPGMTIALDDISVNSSFLEVLAYHMVKNCAYGITGDHNDTKMFDDMYRAALMKATSVMAQQKKDMFVTASTDSWIDARG